MGKELIIPLAFVLCTLLFVLKDYSDIFTLVLIGLISAYYIGTESGKK